MTTADHLRALADFVADVNREGVAVQDVTPAEAGDSVATVALQVDVDELGTGGSDLTSVCPDETDDDVQDDSDDDQGGNGGGPDVFACEQCDYETDSEHGLAIHVGRVHDGDDEDQDDDQEGDQASANGDLLDGVDVTRAELVDALAGTQSLRSLTKALDVNRDTATTLAGRLGVIEQLAAGGSGVDPDEAEQIVAEVVG